MQTYFWGAYPKDRS